MISFSILEPNLCNLYLYRTLNICDLNSEQTEKLQKALNCLVRFVCRLEDYVTPSYIQLGWLKIAERKKLSMPTMLFKILKFHKPEYLYRKFNFLSDIHSVSTRNAGSTFQIPRHNANLLVRTVLLQAIHLHNESIELFDTNKSVILFRNEFKYKLLRTYSQ